MTSWRDLPSHRAWLETEAQRLLAFAKGAVQPHGFGWLDDDGRPLTHLPQPVWITARFTHVFALGALMGAPGAAPLCDHGLRALAGPFLDREHGGWFTEIDANGPTRAHKDAYSFDFVVLALASATLAGRPGAEEALRAALDIVERRFWNEADGAVVEGWDRGWREMEAYRGANANMHAVEAFLAAADALHDKTWARRALRIAERVIQRSARAHDWRVVEHFAPDWTPLPDYNTDHRDHPFRPFGATPGHGFEWARLLVCIGAALPGEGEWLQDAAESLFARAAADGWAEPGGFVYTTDFQGAPVVARRLHWVTTEAIAAAAVLHAATGREVYEAEYRRSWDFADAHFRDVARGSWRHELAEDLAPVSTGTWAGKPDVYHALQTCLIPRLPLSGSVAGALRAGGLG